MSYKHRLNKVDSMDDRQNSFFGVVDTEIQEGTAQEEWDRGGMRSIIILRMMHIT